MVGLRTRFMDKLFNYFKYIYTYIRIFKIRICVYVYICGCVCGCMHVCMCICVCVCVCVCGWVAGCMYVYVLLFVYLFTIYICYPFISFSIVFIADFFLVLAWSSLTQKDQSSALLRVAMTILCRLVLAGSQYARK